MDRLLGKLRGVKIFTVVELACWLSCSVVTARRRIKEWDAHTSYNCNGRYYALPEVPRFDINGLWRCRGAHFSRHGNLRETVRALTAASSAGLSSGEIGSLLGLEARTFLAHFKTDPGLSREPCGRGHVWFAGDGPGRLRQMEARQSLKGAAAELPDADAVLLLVEIIRNPGMDCAALARRLAPSTPRITPEAVDRFLSGHGLLKKKPGSPPSER
jgi:hypothetical protein